MIAALAGISFPVYRSIQKKVEKQQFTMDMDAQARAVENFETEYNYLPYVGAYPANPDTPIDGAGGGATAFFTILVGGESTVNFKSIKFLEAREAKPLGAGYANGLHTAANGNTSYYTPHGTEYFRMQLDYDNDGEILFGYGIGVRPTNLTIMYMEPGPDGIWRTDDDFTNFQDLLDETNYGRN
jgi:hypothetical protein